MDHESENVWTDLQIRTNVQTRILSTRLQHASAYISGESLLRVEFDEHKRQKTKEEERGRSRKREMSTFFECAEWTNPDTIDTFDATNSSIGIRTWSNDPNKLDFFNVTESWRRRRTTSWSSSTSATAAADSLNYFRWRWSVHQHFRWRTPSPWWRIRICTIVGISGSGSRTSFIFFFVNSCRDRLFEHSRVYGSNRPFFILCLSPFLFLGFLFFRCRRTSR